MDTDRIWKALADSARRRMLDLLSERPRMTNDLVEAFPSLCRTNVMKHLDVLVSAGLVVVERRGRCRWNHVNPVPLDLICRRWLNARTRRMASALQRLKAVVESPMPETDLGEQSEESDDGRGDAGIGAGRTV